MSLCVVMVRNYYYYYYYMIFFMRSTMFNGFAHKMLSSPLVMGSDSTACDGSHRIIFYICLIYPPSTLN